MWFCERRLTAMSNAYVVALVVVVVGIGLGRVVLPVLPWRVSVRLRPVEIVLSVMGVLGLGFHCGAMFYRSAIQSLPGTQTAVTAINALGMASLVAFVVPAVLLIVGMRRISTPALAIVVLVLGAVGTTMYDGGPLGAHLTAIFAAVTLLALCAATLIGLPQSSRRIAGSAREE